jgi:MFS family permease
MYLSLLLLLASGIIAGFMGQWWDSGWIWASLLLLIAIIVAMAILGGAIYSRVRKAAGLPYSERGKPFPAEPPRSPEEVQTQLAMANPILLAVVGYGGILVILWLMMFKPF